MVGLWGILCVCVCVGIYTHTGYKNNLITNNFIQHYLQSILAITHTHTHTHTYTNLSLINAEQEKELG